MSEELQESERKELLEKLGIFLPGDEVFKEMLEREGMGYLIRKDVQDSFTSAELEAISKDVDEILAELAASPTGLSGNERIISEVLKKESEKIGTFAFRGITFNVREKGYAWKGEIVLCLSSDDWSKTTKQAELITQITLIKLGRTRGLVPKVQISFEKEKAPAEKSALTLEEAVAEVENFARKSLGDDYIMVKKRLQKHFSTKEDLVDACSEVQRILTLFIDADIARKFDNKVADIIYRVEGD